MNVALVKKMAVFIYPCLSQTNQTAQTNIVPRISDIIPVHQHINPLHVTPSRAVGIVVKATRAGATFIHGEPVNFISGIDASDAARRIRLRSQPCDAGLLNQLIHLLIREQGRFSALHRNRLILRDLRLKSRER